MSRARQIPARCRAAEGSDYRHRSIHAIESRQCGNILLKILLNAGNSPNLGFAYGLFLICISIICVKIAMTRGQSAGVRSLHTSEASQRLHAGDLTYAYLVGLFEGDGYFSITKKIL